MCRTIHCIHMMTGVPESLLKQLFGDFPPPEVDEEKEHGKWLTDSIARTEDQLRASELTLDILKAKPNEGEKLFAVEAFKPNVPGEVGVVTLATYEQTSGGFVVVGKDHLNGQTVQHSTPNLHGLEGLLHSMRHEMVKVARQAVAEDEAKQATERAAAAPAATEGNPSEAQPS